MIRRLLERYLAYRRVEQTRMVLHTLGDHTLRDIGLRRDQIDYLRLDELPRGRAPHREPVRPRVRAITVLRAS